MVRVISTNPHPSVVKEVICRKCGATLSYTPLEVTHSSVTDYGGGTEAYNYIICPNCTNKTEVK